eukprot:49140-Eustigmatos_ZCMA.PRE.1
MVLISPLSVSALLTLLRTFLANPRKGSEHILAELSSADRQNVRLEARLAFPNYYHIVSTDGDLW